MGDTDFIIDDLGAERDQLRADLAEMQAVAESRLREIECLRAPYVEELPGNGEKYETPEDGWVCFHCGIRFTTEHAAAAHFGNKPTGRAACLTERDEAIGELSAFIDACIPHLERLAHRDGNTEQCPTRVLAKQGRALIAKHDQPTEARGGGG